MCTPPREVRYRAPLPCWKKEVGRRRPPRGRLTYFLGCLPPGFCFAGAQLSTSTGAHPKNCSAYAHACALCFPHSSSSRRRTTRAPYSDHSSLTSERKSPSVHSSSRQLLLFELEEIEKTKCRRQHQLSRWLGVGTPTRECGAPRTGQCIGWRLHHHRRCVAFRACGAPRGSAAAEA